MAPRGTQLLVLGTFLALAFAPQAFLSWSSLAPKELSLRGRSLAASQATSFTQLSQAEVQTAQSGWASLAAAAAALGLAVALVASPAPAMAKGQALQGDETRSGSTEGQMSAGQRTAIDLSQSGKTQSERETDLKKKKGALSKEERVKKELAKLQKETEKAKIPV
mmetsp:Transcript_22583/g.49971  ORF Transcript_22583/g.49971 Transcript_22583/m.49971 type:complete len:165 (+) Transcript_22583:53-547(+)